MRNKDRIAAFVQAIGNEQIAIAELEALGLPLRIINLLEDYLGIIWLEDLLMYTPTELKQQVPNLGDKSLRLIFESLNRLEVMLGRMPRRVYRSMTLPGVACKAYPNAGCVDSRG